MTPSKSQKNAARLILGLLLIFGLVVMGMPGISLGQIPVVQQTTSSPSSSPSGSSSASPSSSSSPSASGTASPAPTGPAIQFLNPSDHSTVVSTKDDGSNTTYHLVAAARAVPSNPLVEFKYQEGDANEVSIGIGTRVGLTDTFEFNWSPGTLADGEYTLKAILYNGAVELSRDEIDVTVNNEDTTIPPPPDPQAETVEIVSPANGAGAGFYDPPGADLPHTIVDVTSSDDTGFPSTSTGTETVTVFYSKTPIGTEPEWVECGSGGGEAAEDPPTSIRCTLEEGDTPLQVTGVAAVADAVAPVVGGSGDAHRVFSYVQTPTTVTAAPLNQNKPAGTCSDAIVATVLDQNNKKIAGINTDVHAKGPNDGTLFDTVNNSENQPPDKAHSSPEAGWDCDAGEEAGEQGQHEYPPGNPDTKHVESIDGTSDEAGQFTFQLYATAAGATDYAVFADADDDDQWCAAEKSVEGTVTWSATASPSPSGSSSPSSSPSSSSSGSPSAQPTSTTNPGPTELGPDIAACPTPTTSPTSTSGPGNRSISLVASKSRVVNGGSVRLSGQVQSETASCEDNEVVEIQRRIHGTQEFKPFKTTASDESGNYSVTTKPSRGADYQAIAPAQGSCDEATSSTATVRVRPKVTIAASRAEAPRGEDVRIVGKVTPNHKGDKVTLQRKKGTKWVKVATDQLSSRSRYRFVQTVSWAQRKFRVVFPKQDADHLKGVSRSILIRAS